MANFFLNIAQESLPFFQHNKLELRNQTCNQIEEPCGIKIEAICLDAIRLYKKAFILCVQDQHPTKTRVSQAYNIILKIAQCCEIQENFIIIKTTEELFSEDWFQKLNLYIGANNQNANKTLGFSLHDYFFEQVIQCSLGRKKLFLNLPGSMFFYTFASALAEQIHVNPTMAQIELSRRRQELFLILPNFDGIATPCPDKGKGPCVTPPQRMTLEDVTNSPPRTPPRNLKSYGNSPQGKRVGSGLRSVSLKRSTGKRLLIPLEPEDL